MSGGFVEAITSLADGAIISGAILTGAEDGGNSIKNVWREGEIAREEIEGANQGLGALDVVLVGGGRGSERSRG